MRHLRPLLLFLPVPLALVATACDSGAKEQLRVLAHADSLRQDSLVSLKNDILNEVMTSTQFVNDINTELAKARALHPSKLRTALTTESEIDEVKEERQAVLAKIAELTARLDAAEARLAGTRERAAALSKHDATLVAQVKLYEKTIADLRAATERQRAELQAVIDRQTVELAALNERVDTLQKATVRLAGERAALTDTVSALTTEKNTVYYVAGTRAELLAKGVLVEEGRKRFLLVGGRHVEPARDLDPAAFTRLDRLRDRTITLPEGEYTILTRHNPAYASPFSEGDGHIVGGLRVDQPERFWAPSRFLILVKS